MREEMRLLDDYVDLLEIAAADRERFQHWKKAWIEIWREAWIEGWRKGIIEGGRSTLITLGERKLGPADPSIIEAINAIGVTRTMAF